MQCGTTVPTRGHFVWWAGSLWAKDKRPGPTWMDSNCLTMPDGQVSHCWAIRISICTVRERLWRAFLVPRQTANVFFFFSDHPSTCYAESRRVCDQSGRSSWSVFIHDQSLLRAGALAHAAWTHQNLISVTGVQVLYPSSQVFHMPRLLAVMVLLVGSKPCCDCLRGFP